MSSPCEPIAVVGTAHRFPGGCNNTSELWELLRKPRDLLREIPRERFNIDAFYHSDPTHHGTTNTRQSYFLDQDPAKFDTQFFSIPPKEAESIDPQQRLLMETVYDSLCSAGIPMEQLRGSSTAVYVGLMCDDWSSMIQKDIDALPTYTGTGVARSIMSNRISYFFDWQGPSMTIDTACSSSLVAVHEAVRVLRSGESSVAIAAGANLILNPTQYVAESNLRMLSPTGRSRMWDVSADGYARGEGVASVVLKTLSQAIADGDTIECVIRETGVNQDGRTSGLTVPSNLAQTKLIRDTYGRAGLDPSKASDRPQFFHAHGTGTKAGDPQEAEAIHNAFFSESTNASEKMYVGSIKTIIGHTEGTAGLASLIGTSLAIRNSTIPPNMHFNKLNPDITPYYNHLEVPTVAHQWPSGATDANKRASINSFGFGGTNAHAILEAYVPQTSNVPNIAISSPEPALFTPLVFSAASSASLKSLLSNYFNFLTLNPNVSLRDLSWNLQHRQSTLGFRKVIAGRDYDEICNRIKEEISGGDAGFDGRSANIAEPEMLGVFTGQGAQWPRMCAGLLEASPFVAQRVAELDSSLAALPESDRPSWTIRGQILADASSSRIAEACISQPLCTAVQVLLVDLLEAAGIRFKAVVGHSSGEIGAAYAAGLISAHDAIRVAYYRGLHAKLASSPGAVKKRGAMAAVGISHEEAEELCDSDVLKGRISVAAYNSLSSLTLSGDEDAIEEAIDILKTQSKFARRLKVDTAYHSAHMEACAGPYIKSLKQCALKPLKPAGNKPQWFSSVREDVVMTSETLDEQYWVDNMTQPVMFSSAVLDAADGIESLSLAVEVGPHAALKGPATDNLGEVGIQIPYTGVLHRGKEDVTQFSSALGFLWSHTAPGVVNFERFDETTSADPTPRVVLKDLPSYPFNHQSSYWAEPRSSKALKQQQTGPSMVLGTAVVTSAASDEVQWRNMLTPKEVPWIQGHKLQGQIIFPATGYIAMAIEALQYLASSDGLSHIKIQDLVLERAIVFNDENSTAETLFSLKLQASGDKISASFACFSCPEGETSLTKNATGCIEARRGRPIPDSLPFFPPQGRFNMVDVGVDRFYLELSKIGYHYSEPFKGISDIKRKMGTACGNLIDQSGSAWEDQLVVHPGMLDTALQTLFAALSYPGDESLKALHVPVRVDSVTINPFFSQAYGGKQASVPWESVVRDEEKSHVKADVQLLSEDANHTFVQIEGVSLKPLTAPRPEDDSTLFSHFEYLRDGPDGESAAIGDRLSPEELRIAKDMERIAFFYLRQVSEMSSEDRANALPHHQHLMAWGNYTVDKVRKGEHMSVDPECLEDTQESILELTNRHRDRVDALLIESTGQNLPDTIRANASILQHMTKDNLLSRFYEEGIGLNTANWWLAKMVKQISHRYPHMKILEIGAGTGGTTQATLPSLGTSFSSYTYTDVSSGFFEAAEDKFKDYADRMIFKVFDMVKTPEEQGFTEGSYDMILASNVLHVAEDLDVMMNNVRKLLKPGGFLVNLETVTNDMLRNGIIMGGLPGWWIGADSGRPHGPMLNLKSWDSLLQRCGFDGIETSTPIYDSLHAVAVWAAQATDERVQILKSPSTALPSSFTADAHLVTVGGKSLSTFSMMEKIRSTLQPRFSSSEHVSSIEALSMELLPPGATVLSLADLDEPVMKSVTEEKMNGLKALWKQARNILWVTKGVRCENPYSYMMFGIGRVVRFENPNINLKLLDVDNIGGQVPQYIAKSLLQHQLLDDWRKQGEIGELTWSSEPEVFLEGDTTLIPRLYPNKQQNDRVNSTARKIFKDADPATTNLRLVSSGDSVDLEEITALESMAAASLVPATADIRNIRIVQSLLQCVRIGDVGSLMLCVGIDQDRPGSTILALTDAATSPTPVAAACCVEIPSSPEVGKMALTAVAAGLVAKELISSVPKGCTLLVHEAGNLLKAVISAKSKTAGISTVFTTCQNEGRNTDSIFIHPALPTRLLRKHVPSDSCVFADFSAIGSTGAGIGHAISTLLPAYCSAVNSATFFSDMPQLRPGSSITQAKDLLTMAWEDATSGSIPTDAAATVPLGDISSFNPVQETLTVVNWTEPMVPVRVRPIDNNDIFRSDRTYLLIGLSGEVGQSLCQWMVEHGACHVVLTSRKPVVDPEFVHSLECKGANIRAMPLDITSRESLIQCLRIINRSMPKIGGIANGALIVDDGPFTEMSLESMNRVLKPKVDGSILLDEVFHDEPLDFFIMFSSLTACLGNSGQSNYAAANMFMTTLAFQRRKRGVPGSVIDLSSLMGIGHVGRSDVFNADYFRSLGATSVSETDLHQMFAEAMDAGRPDANTSAEVVTGMSHMLRSELEDTKVQYRMDLKFSHFCIEQAGNQGQESTALAVPVRAQLKDVKTRGEATRILLDSFIARVKKVLQIPADEAVDENVALVERGVDSLVALDIRSWFMRELDVDMPVLKVLGGNSIAELIKDSMDKMPTSVLDTSALTDDANNGLMRPASSVNPDPQHTKPTVMDSSKDLNGLSLPEAIVDGSSTAPSTNGWNSPALNSQDDGAKSVSSAEDEPTKESSSSESVIQSSSEVTEHMSFGQTRFWYLHHAIEDKTTFNVALSIRLDGNLQLDNFDKALKAVAEKHEAMRTRYFWSGEDMDVATQGVLEHPLIRLEHRTIADKSEASKALLEMRDHEWDLSNWDSMRFVVLSLSDDVHWFIFGCHHISIDGVGIQIIFADLEKAYQGQALKPLSEASQYRSYSVLQRNQLQNGDFQKDIDFYRNIIPPDVEPIALLPFSKLAARRPQTSYSTHRADVRLDKEATARIKQVARQNQSTNFHLYLAVLQGLLFRLLPKTDEIFVGIADANRNNGQFVETLGFFLNLLPIRFDRPTTGSRFSTAVKGARNKAYAALEHSSVPFDVLLNELGVTRSANTPPVFQVFVDYRQGTQERAKFAGFDVAGEEWYHPRTGYDISLDVLENAEGDSLVTLQLQQSLYTQQHTELLLRAYVNLLKGLTRSPGRDFRIDAPSVWADEDISTALSVAKGPQSPLQWPETVSHRVDQMIGSHGPELALKDGRGRALTYTQMNQRVGTIAASLIDSGITKGDIVGVLQEPSADWICSMLAIFRVGATYLPLDLRNSTHRLHKAVKAARPTTLLVDTATSDVVKTVEISETAVINISTIPEDAFAHLQHTYAEADSAAVILFTSGSTGEPKGIVIRHSNLVAQNEGFSKQCDVENGKVSKVLQQSALSFDFSLEQILVALCNGGCLYVVPPEDRGDPHEVTKLILEEGINYTSGTPSEYAMWFQNAQDRLKQCKQWNYAFFGGEPFSDDFIQNFRGLDLPSLRVFNNYGPGETTIACTHQGEIMYKDEGLEYPLTAGFAAPNYEIYIVDDQLNALPVGVPGEILIGGAGVSAGYLDMDAATKEKFLPNPFAKDSPNLSKNGWSTVYRTGDRGHMRSDGALRIEGRIDNDTQIKIRGFRVELSEVEKVILESAEGNLKHAVVTTRESNGADFLAGHVVFSQGTLETNRTEFLEGLQAKLPLPEYMRPAVIIPLEEIPLTSHSKFDRAAVKALPVDTSSGVSKSPEEDRELTSGEAKLAELWRSVLPVAPTRAIHSDASFFHVGGSSLLLVKLQRKIKEEFSAAPKLVELMNASKLGEMLAVITAASSRHIDWETETAIPECWGKKFALSDTSDEPHHQKKGLNVLLTGATGYLGRHLVPDLVQSVKIAKLFCIVRRETDVELLSKVSDKVVIFTGDLGEPNCGLKDEETAQLTSESDLILHCGANRSFWDDYEVLRPVNTDSVKELVQIALPRRIPFHFLSSGSVRIYGTKQGPDIYNIDQSQQRSNRPPVDGTDGYVASKWAAEVFLRQVATKFNLPVTVHTPMPVPGYGPDDSHAEAESDHMVNELVEITKKLQVRPTMEGLGGWADIVPTQMVVRDIMDAISGDQNGHEDAVTHSILHTGVRRINWQRFIAELQNNPHLNELPSKDTLLWIGQAKRSGYSYFMPAHRLVVLSSEGDMVSRR